MRYQPNPRTAHPTDDSSGSNESDEAHQHWGGNRAGRWDDSSQHSRTPRNIQEPSYPSTQIGGMAKTNGMENYQDQIIFRICQLIHSMVGVY
jgi:hypothetical protein